MGFLCNKKDAKKDVDIEKLNEQNFLRYVSLDNVHSVYLDPVETPCYGCKTNNYVSGINFCNEVFKNPTFYVSGATKLYSGVTTTLTGCTTGYTDLGVYNLDYTPDINVNFIVTGDTSYLSYNGVFGLKTFSKESFTVTNNVGGLPNGGEIVNSTFYFSGITTGVTQEYPEGGLIKTWGEYMIRPYYIFVTQNCNEGLIFNTWDSVTQLNSFNNETDYYFMTVINPPKPVLASPDGKQVDSSVFIQDILLSNGVSGPREQTVNNGYNNFILKTQPVDLSQIMVFLNGVKLTSNVDYTTSFRGFSVPPVVIFNNEIKSTDVIVANYFSGVPSAFSNSDFSKWFTNNIVVNTIGSTNPGLMPTEPSVVYNSTTGNYEIYLTQPIESTNSVFLTINGIEMVQDRQFYLSTSQSNRIILDKTYSDSIKIGDIISVLATSPDNIFGTKDYGSLSTNEFQAQWIVNFTLPENVSSEFIMQVVDYNDSGYTTTLYQNVLPFVEGSNSYNSTVTSLSLNQYYRFRIIHKTTYTGYLDNKVTTCSYDEGFFNTKNSYINNTY